MKCVLCDEEAKSDEWANHEKKICIDCDSQENGFFDTREPDEPKETNQQ